MSATRLFVFLKVIGTFALALVCVALAYWWLNRRFQAGDPHACNGLVQNPVAEHLLIRNVVVWDGLTVHLTGRPRRLFLEFEELGTHQHVARPPVWSRPVGDPILPSNRTRRIDFALFMVEALTNDALIHEAPAIVGCGTPSALAHAVEGGSHHHGLST